MNAYPGTSKLGAYQNVSAHGGVAAADPHRLVLLLMNTAIERLTAARGCIEHGEIARKAKLLHSVTTIIAELRGSLDMARGGALAQNLSDLYDYMARRILVGNATNNVAAVAEVLNLLSEIRDAWAAIAPEVQTPRQPSAA